MHWNRQSSARLGATSGKGKCFCFPRLRKAQLRQVYLDLGHLLPHPHLLPSPPAPTPKSGGDIWRCIEMAVSLQDSPGGCRIPSGTWNVPAMLTWTYSLAMSLKWKGLSCHSKSMVSLRLFIQCIVFVTVFMDSHFLNECECPIQS